MFDLVLGTPTFTWCFKFSSFVFTISMEDLREPTATATDEFSDVTVAFVEVREVSAAATDELSDVTDDFINVNDSSNFLIPGSTICSLISSLSLSNSVLLYMVFTIKLCE